jgi:hypothetical protein
MDRRTPVTRRSTQRSISKEDLNFCGEGASKKELSVIADNIFAHPSVVDVAVDDAGDDHYHLLVNVFRGADRDEIEQLFNLQLEERRKATARPLNKAKTLRERKGSPPKVV